MNKDVCTIQNIDVKKNKEGKYELYRDKIFTENDKNLYVINNNKLDFSKNIKYYAIQNKSSQCNNNIEQWNKWFTIPYYYLGNRDGRYNEISENNITYTIDKGCFKECNDNFIINNEYRCEDKKTFKDGKYRNYIPYDPFAIICIIGSINNNNTISNRVYKEFKTENAFGLKGNYYDTIDTLLKDDNPILKDNALKITQKIKNLILVDIKEGISPKSPKSPLHLINADVKNAYKKILEYANYIYTENEQDKVKIESNIKKDINKFYTLFDKRDELYMKYLNNFNKEKKKLNLLYAYNLCTKQSDIISDICNFKLDNKSFNKDILAVIQYLFKYCYFVCFSKYSIFAERLSLYGIYNQIKEGKIAEVLQEYKPPEYDKDCKFTSDTTTKSTDLTPVTTLNINSEKKDYTISQIKLDNKAIFIFEDYSHILRLYKSFFTVYPVVFIIIITIFVFLLILYIVDVILCKNRPISLFLNLIYSYLIWFNYIFKWFALNKVFTFIVKILLLPFYTNYPNEKFNEIIRYITNIYLTPIIILILVIFIIILISTISIDDIIRFIPATIIFILESIYFLILILLSLILNIPKIENLILIAVITYIIILYYHIIYIFNYTDIEGIVGSSITTGNDKYADLLNGGKLIATLRYVSDSQTIVRERNKIINYAYLLKLYQYAFNRINELNI